MTWQKTCAERAKMAFAILRSFATSSQGSKGFCRFRKAYRLCILSLCGCILSSRPHPEFEPLLLRGLEAALQGISLEPQSRERSDCDRLR